MQHCFVVCAYKKSPYLSACIRSLLAQTVESKILISTSTDNEYIEAVAAKYNIPVLTREGTPEIAEDWNFALRVSDTAYVTLAHQDDFYEPSYTENVLKALSTADNPLIAFSDYYEIHGRKRVKRNLNLQVKRILLSPLRLSGVANTVIGKHAALALGNPICCPAVTYVRKRMPEPLFEANMGSNIDWQAWLRLSAEEGTFVYVPSMLMGHRIHAQSTTTEFIEQNLRTEEDLKMLEKTWPAPIAKLINRVYKYAEKSNTK